MINCECAMCVPPKGARPSSPNSYGPYRRRAEEARHGLAEMEHINDMMKRVALAIAYGGDVSKVITVDDLLTARETLQKRITRCKVDVDFYERKAARLG